MHDKRAGVDCPGIEGFVGLNLEDRIRRYVGRRLRGVRLQRIRPDDHRRQYIRPSSCRKRGGLVRNRIARNVCDPAYRQGHQSVVRQRRMWNDQHHLIAVTETDRIRNEGSTTGAELNGTGIYGQRIYWLAENQANIRIVTYIRHAIRW